MVWLGGEELHPVAEIVRLNKSVEVALECDLVGRHRGWRSESSAYPKGTNGRTRDQERYSFCKSPRHSLLLVRSPFVVEANKELQNPDIRECPSSHFLDVKAD